MFFNAKKYKVGLRGRSGVTYSEGTHKALIDAEMMSGSTDLVIYFDLFCSWKPPFQEEILSDEDRSRIKKNISTELENKGLIIEWD